MNFQLYQEFVKTYGHYHPEKVTGYSYTELYSVLEGEATYLMQHGSGVTIDDIYCVKAKAGDNVIIPPNYGHITINASDKQLKMANWVCNGFSSVYGEIDKLGGGAYHLLKGGWASVW